MISGIYTAILLIIFVSLWIWAWSSRRRRDFDEAARLAVEETTDDANEPKEPRA
ncbi:MAG: cbb3-type cytochrome c oxidase subunit 3 [Dokdonella sp.]